MIRRLASVSGVAIVLGALMGCAQGDGGPEGTAAPAQTSSPTEAQSAPAAAVAAPVDIDAPEGWTKSTRSGWVIWTSPDKLVQLGVAPLEDASSTEPKLPALEALFGVTGVRLNPQQPLNIGVEQLSAHGSDGSAHFASGDGGIAYAVLEPRGAKRVAVAYAFERGATDEARQQMMTAVGSIRKKQQ